MFSQVHAWPAIGAFGAAVGFLLSAAGAMQEGLDRHALIRRMAIALLFLPVLAWPIFINASAIGIVFPAGHFAGLAGLGCIFAMLVSAGGRKVVEGHAGYRWVMSGFWLLFLQAWISLCVAGGLFGPAGAAVEGVGSFVCGAAGVTAIAIGFWKWLPGIWELAEARARLESRKVELEAEVAGRMADLEAEIEIRRNAEHMAAAANNAKSKFLANMSHELRTPLNAVIGFSDLLTGQNLIEGEKVKEYASDINDAGRHLLALVNDILDLAKIESGKMEIADEEVSATYEIARALRTLEPKAAERKIKLEADVEPDLVLRGDGRAVQQILLNLLSNAIKFTPRGGSVRIVASVVMGQAKITVIDTGCGIPSNKLQSVFEAFEQVENVYSRSEGGTGLGLALSRRLARLMKGDIVIESTIDVGTAVTLTMSAAEPVA